MNDRETVYGYDGLGYSVGDRVELHPGTDLWMQGARYGTVTRISPMRAPFVNHDKSGECAAEHDGPACNEYIGMRVYAKLDRQARGACGAPDTFKRID